MGALFAGLRFRRDFGRFGRVFRGEGETGGAAAVGMEIGRAERLPILRRNAQSWTRGGVDGAKIRRLWVGLCLELRGFSPNVDIRENHLGTSLC